MCTLSVVWTLRLGVPRAWRASPHGDWLAHPSCSGAEGLTEWEGWLQSGIYQQEFHHVPGVLGINRLWPPGAQTGAWCWAQGNLSLVRVRLGLTSREAVGRAVNEVPERAGTGRLGGFWKQVLTEAQGLPADSQRLLSPGAGPQSREGRTRVLCPSRVRGDGDTVPPRHCCVEGGVPV